MKASGGTRNYRPSSSAYGTRRAEYDEILRKYEVRDSYFDKSGGYYVVHKGHNAVTNPDMNKENEAVLSLARHGCKINLMSEYSYIKGIRKYDGFENHSMCDIKTINKADKTTIKNALESAAKQRASVVVLYQNTMEMTSEYVSGQIELFKQKSAGLLVSRIKEVIVVGNKNFNKRGASNIHRHKL